MQLWSWQEKNDVAKKLPQFRKVFHGTNLSSLSSPALWFLEYMKAFHIENL